MKKYVWVGPRESDIKNSSIKFDASITWFGEGDNNISYINELSADRKEYSHNGRPFISFIENKINSLFSGDEYQIVFYNPIQYYLIPDKSNIKTICINKLDVLNIIRNKGSMRNYISDIVDVVPFVSFSGEQIPKIEFCSDKVILQECISSGGNGTYLLNHDECNSFLQKEQNREAFIVSPYLNDSIPINVHMVIFDDDCIVFPVSHQIIYNENETFRFIGADFFTDFTEKTHQKIIENSTKIGNRLRKIGYRGVCGIDFLVKEDIVYFLEVNPRFQASTFLLNDLLYEENLPSIQELNIMAFNGDKKPFDSFYKFKKCKSYFNVIDNDIRFRQIFENKRNLVFTDGYASFNSNDNDYYYRFRIVMNRNISWVDYDKNILIAPNILPDTEKWKKKILKNDMLALKISLLNQGVRISSSAYEQMKKSGMIRQGVFQSVDLKFNNGLIINAPYLTDFSDFSPYEIDYRQNYYVLTYYNKVLHCIHFDTLDVCRSKTASNGTTYGNVSFLATDRLRVHHQFKCYFKMQNLGCKFCNVKPKEGSYNLEDVFEIIDYYLKNVEFRHFLIGGGSGIPEIEQHNIMEIAKYIKKKSTKPIYAMCLPPENVEILDSYKQCGVDEVSFNIEIFNRDIAQQTMPGKGRIPLNQYEEALKKAVSIWGKSGNVRSMLVLGMEPLEDFYNGVKWLCEIGVMPIISVFRPVTNIAMKEVLPYSNTALYGIYREINKITAKFKLIPGPPCISCQNNTLSLPTDYLMS